MRVRDIMTRTVETVSSRDSAVFANELMWRKTIHHLLVMDGEQVVGVVSDRDLGIGPDKREIPDDQPVSAVMSREIITIDPNATVDRIINIFGARHISCLPVLEDGKLVGIVTTTDVENVAKQGMTNPPPRGWGHGPQSQSVPGNPPGRQG